MAKGNIFDYTRVRSPDMDEIMKNIDTAFAVGNPSTVTTAYTVTSADFGTTIRINSASTVTVTLPAVGASDDGATITFIKQGAGDIAITAGTGDYIDGSPSSGSTYSSDTKSALKIQYVHGMTEWVVIDEVGTFATM